MTSQEFTIWLQGFFEMVNPKTISNEQIKIIQRHLDLVFYYESMVQKGSKPKEIDWEEFRKKMILPDTDSGSDWDVVYNC